MTMAAQSTVELRPFAALDDVADVWPKVAAHSANLFATWEWATTWWRHFGAGRPLAGTIAYKPSGDPVAILPLYRSARRPLSMLRFIGHGPSDWMGPIYRPGDEGWAAAALRATLARDQPRWDVLLAEHVRADALLDSELAGTVLRREGFPILEFRDRSWEELLGERSSNFRQQVRRHERKLARSHKLTYRLSEDPERLDTDLDLVFMLHNARWGPGESDALTPPRQAFHRDFARHAQARGWLRLWVMELDGAPVAAWYGFRYAGVEWYYQAGRDPAHEADRVGFVLLTHTIRAALEDGATAYWFLRGDEAFKNRFAELDPGVLTFAIAGGATGRAAIALIRLLDSAPDPVRRWTIARAG